MPDILQIQHADADSLPALLDLYAHLNPDDVRIPTDEAARRLEQLGLYSGSAILVGISHGRLVSTCTLLVIPNLTRAGAPYALIENVVTDKHCRGRGFGTALLDHATKLAWTSGCYKVMLLTGSKEAGTLAFYTKAGFQQSKTGFQKRRPVTP